MSLFYLVVESKESNQTSYKVNASVSSPLWKLWVPGICGGWKNQMGEDYMILECRSSEWAMLRVGEDDTKGKHSPFTTVGYLHTLIYYIRSCSI